MPDHSPATDRQHREEAADGGYFAALTQGSHLLLTTFRPKGAPVSTRVQGITEGDRAYFRVPSRSGTARFLRRAGRVQVQVTTCNALGLVSYGTPRFAAVRPLSDEDVKQGTWTTCSASGTPCSRLRRRRGEHGRGIRRDGGVTTRSGGWFHPAG